VIVELRQYTHQPGRRDEFVELFEGPLYDPLEAAGMDIVGVFGDLDDSDRTVWLRSFPDMAARLAALEEFYDSELWWSHRDAVNATLVDSDNVLLLNAVVEPHAVGEPGVYTAVVWPSAHLSEELGARDDTVALLVTEPSENDFPRLPVREGENVVVWLAAGDVEPPQTGAEPVQTLRLAPTARSRLA
jgi:NIPSNAP